MSRIHTEPQEIDPACWAEVLTDAGTRDPYAFREGPDPDLELDRRVELELLRELAVAALRKAAA